MKYMPLILMFSLLFLTACQETKTKSSSSSSQNALCNQGTNYYCVQGCGGFGQNPTICGTNTNSCNTGNNYYCMSGCPGYGQNTSLCGTTNNSCYSGNNYWCVSGCPGYGQYPQVCGTTTGGTTGGTTTNPFPSYPNSPLPADPHWADLYPKGTPTGTCAPATTPSGISYTPYDTRMATLTLAGGKTYDPSLNETMYTTSDILKTVEGAQSFFSTDAVLKVRFKARTQPNSARSNQTCYGRATGQSSQPGYTKLMFSVEVVGIKENGSIGKDPIGVYEVGVNSCQPTPGKNLATMASKYPNGMYLRIYDVYSNTGCSYTDNYGRNIGFYDCNSWKLVRQAECWSIDIEVAADGTKTF